LCASGHSDPFSELISIYRSIKSSSWKLKGLRVPFFSNLLLESDRNQYIDVLIYLANFHHEELGLAATNIDFFLIDVHILEVNQAIQESKFKHIKAKKNNNQFILD